MQASKILDFKITPQLIISLAEDAGHVFPKDLEVVGVRVDPSTGLIYIRVRSDKYEAIPECCEMPEKWINRTW